MWERKRRGGGVNIPTNITNAYAQVHIVDMLLAQMIERRALDDDDMERLVELEQRLKLATKELALSLS